MRLPLPGIGGTRLSSASRYGSLQRAFSDRLREWHWQRNEGTFYQVWRPPGVVFCRLRKDHHELGGRTPPWPEWGFEEEEEIGDAPPLRLVLGALGGRWVLRQASAWPHERWVLAEGDDARCFRAFCRAMSSFGLEVDHPDVSFPNMRFLYTNERIAPKLLEAGSVHSVHVHLPWAARATRPQRDALVNGRFVSNASDAMAIHGELHIVTDSEAVAEEACGVLTRSRLFAPCLAFPFHEAGVPSSYPAAELLHADIDEALGCKAKQPMFYTRWEKRQPHLPNFRFRGGKGYADAAQGLLTGRGGGR